MSHLKFIYYWNGLQRIGISKKVKMNLKERMPILLLYQAVPSTVKPLLPG